MWGGKRPGAGRKAVDGARRVVVGCGVSPEMASLIDRVTKARGLTRSEVVRLALEQFQPVMEDMAK